MVYVGGIAKSDSLHSLCIHLFYTGTNLPWGAQGCGYLYKYAGSVWMDHRFISDGKRVLEKGREKACCTGRLKEYGSFGL